MNQQNSIHAQSISPAEIAGRVEARIKVCGLKQTLVDFEAMERILSGLDCWAEVKRLCEQLFVEERKREQRVELEHLRAMAPSIYQILPTAKTGIGMDGGTQPVSLTQQISGSQVFNGNITNSEF